LQPNLPLIACVEVSLSDALGPPGECAKLACQTSIKSEKKKKGSDTEREREWVRPNNSEERRRLRLSKLTQRRTRNHILLWPSLTLTVVVRVHRDLPSPLSIVHQTVPNSHRRLPDWMDDALTGKKKKGRKAPPTHRQNPPASAFLRTTPALPKALLPPLPGPPSFPSMGFRI
jgi:hypothetical protein